ncbi:hypothetical protein [Salinarimonas sp.]|uniref:hypothetical protein n=1 Tax=Salinarimonas sp. TaxID=2766526 RepID=UPI0039187C89
MSVSSPYLAYSPPRRTGIADPLGAVTRFSIVLLIAIIAASIILPETLVSAASGTTVLLLTTLSGLVLLARSVAREPSANAFMIVFLLFLLVSAISLASSDYPDLNEAYKRSLSILLPIGMLMLKMPKDFRVVHVISSVAIWAILLFVMTQPAYFHESEFLQGAADRAPRLWPFYGMSPHSSGYFVGALLLIVYFSRPLRQSLFGRLILWATIGAALYMLLGFRSMQAIITVLAFVGGALMSLRNISMTIKSAAITIVAAAALYFFIDKILVNIQLTGTFQFESIGSGRVGTWIGRVEDIIAISDFRTLLFGSGPGSDFYVGAMWNKVTTSHNTFLTYLVEYGFVGLGLLVLCIVMMALVFQGAAYPIVAAIVISSLIGNGLLMRMPVLVLFSFAGVVFYHHQISTRARSRANAAGQRLALEGKKQ